MLTDVSPKVQNTQINNQNERLRELGRYQATVIGKCVVEGLAISPAVVDEFLVMHGLGHVAIEVTDDRLDPHALIDELQNAG